MHDNKAELDFVEQGEDTLKEPGWAVLTALMGMLMVGGTACLLLIAGAVQLAVAYAYDYWQDRWGTATAVLRIERGFEACEKECQGGLMDVGSRYVYLPNETPIFQLLFGCSRNPCTISESPGGTGIVYELAALAARSQPQMRFEVAGYCASACVRFLDLAREQVCVSKKASIGLHLGTAGHYSRLGYKPTTYLVPNLSDDLIEGVRQLGGFPLNGDPVFLKLEQARRVWRICDEHPPEARALRLQPHTWNVGR